MENSLSRILVIAPNYRQIRLFGIYMGWHNNSYQIALKPEDLMGLRLDAWEVWWLDRMWPCRTHADVVYMMYMKYLARQRGADIHHWWT